MWKNIVEQSRPQMAIWRMLIADCTKPTQQSGITKSAEKNSYIHRNEWQKSTMPENNKNCHPLPSEPGIKISLPKKAKIERTALQNTSKMRHFLAKLLAYHPVNNRQQITTDGITLQQ